jgi:sigma-B regulation protein RsbU (phosphoserine phosphatase)
LYSIETANNMKKIILLIILLLFSCSNENNNQQPVVKKGVLDLRNWSLEKDGPVHLNGQWKFFWKEFIPSGKIAEKRKFQYIDVPSDWHSEKKDKKNLNSYGFATYYLKILLNPESDPLAFKIPTINCAYRAFLNGKEINSVGKVGKSRNTMKAAYRPVIVDFADKSHELNLMIHVSNYHQRFSGMWEPLYFGKARDLVDMKRKKLYLTLFLAGVFIIMCIYHIGLFILRPGEKLPLYFALFCLLLALRIVSYGEIVLVDLLPGLPMAWVKKIEYNTFYLGIITGCLFLYKLFPIESSKKIFVIFNIPVVIISIITFISPIQIFTHLLFIVQIVALTLFIYILYIITLAVMRKRDGAVVFFLGVLALLITTTHDILSAVSFLDGYNWTPYGFLIMIFFQSYMISTKFSRAFVTVEQLSNTLEIRNEELEQLNLNLEKMVAERTDELKAAYDSVNDAYAIIQKDLSLAQNLQESMLTGDITHVEGIRAYVHYFPMMQVGGDIYDIYEKENNRIRVFLADATGHGIQAALATMIIKSEYDRLKTRDLGPSEVLRELNKKFFENYSSSSLFFTCVLMDIDTAKGNIVFASAGHPDQMLLKEKKIHELPRTGKLIGFVNNASYEEVQYEISVGDRILLFSDGIYEEFDTENQEYGDERLFELVENNVSLPMKDMLSMVLDNVMYFINSDRPNLNDDVTLIGIVIE